MAGTLRVPRSRGAVSGLLLVLFGAWGALIPFVGPYFNYAYTPASAWTYTSGRLWLSILPGAAAIVGGLVLLFATVRPVALMGAGLAAASGAWFAVGAVLSPIWADGSVNVGTPVGDPAVRALEELGFFVGLGVVIVFLAAMAFGRLTVVGVRDARFAGYRPGVGEARITRPGAAPVRSGAGTGVSAGTGQQATVPGTRPPAG